MEETIELPYVIGINFKSVETMTYDDSKYVAGVCNLLYKGIPHTSFSLLVYALAHELGLPYVEVHKALTNACKRFTKR